MSATRSEPPSEPRVPDAVTGAGPEPARSVSREKLVLFLRNPTGMLGLALVVMFFASAIFAHIFATHSPLAMDIPNRLAGPTAEHWAGTDQLGRDTFSRVLHGGRVALKVAAVGVSVSLAVGLLLGMLAGFGPQWLDNVLLLLFDSIRSFPTVVLALAQEFGMDVTELSTSDSERLVSDMHEALADPVFAEMIPPQADLRLTASNAPDPDAWKKELS